MVKIQIKRDILYSLYSRSNPLLSLSQDKLQGFVFIYSPLYGSVWIFFLNHLFNLEQPFFG